MPYKEYSDSYLMSMPKKEIIKILRIAEHNFRATEEAVKNQAEYMNKELPKMRLPFENDMFAMCYQALRNLYPEKKCTCYWEPEIREEEDGTKVLGLTDFDQDTGECDVFVDPKISVTDAVEIFAHELAHVAVGVEHGHDEAWEKAFDALYDEYNRIGDEMFPKRQTVTAIDGKKCVKDGDV